MFLLVNKNCSLHYDAQKKHDVIKTIAHKKTKNKHINAYSHHWKHNLFTILSKSVIEFGPNGAVKIEVKKLARSNKIWIETCTKLYLLNNARQVEFQYHFLPWYDMHALGNYRKLVWGLQSKAWSHANIYRAMREN